MTQCNASLLIIGCPPCVSRACDMHVELSTHAWSVVSVFTGAGTCTSVPCRLQKDRPSWQNTFRHRIIILAPLFMMYAAGSGLLPMPLRHKFEERLGRPAITLAEFDKAEKAQLKAAKEAAEAAKKLADEAAVDALLAKA